MTDYYSLRLWWTGSILRNALGLAGCVIIMVRLTHIISATDREAVIKARNDQEATVSGQGYRTQLNAVLGAGRWSGGLFWNGLFWAEVVGRLTRANRCCSPGPSPHLCTMTIKRKTLRQSGKPIMSDTSQKLTTQYLVDAT